MHLYVVRHGKAERESRTGLDEDRRLKNRGRCQAEFLGSEIAGLVHRPALILHSGHARALETASLVHAGFERAGLHCRMEHAAVLQLGHTASEAVSLVQSHADQECLMIVGHQPQLGDVIAALVRGLPGGAALLRTGEAVLIRLSPEDPIGTSTMLRRIRIDAEEAMGV